MLIKITYISELTINCFTFCFINTFYTFLRAITILRLQFFCWNKFTFFCIILLSDVLPNFVYSLWIFSFAESKFWLTIFSCDIDSTYIILLLFLYFIKYIFFLVELSSSSYSKILLLIFMGFIFVWIYL